MIVNLLFVCLFVGSQSSPLNHLLRKNISSLKMSQEKELLWIPVLTFENTENKPFTLADEKTSITVKKQGEFSLSKVFSRPCFAFYSYFFLRLRLILKCNNNILNVSICVFSQKHKISIRLRMLKTSSSLRGRRTA